MATRPGRLTTRPHVPGDHAATARGGRALRLPAVLAALAAAACSHGAAFLWVDQIPQEQVATGEYRVEAGDVIGVRVWQQDAMSIDRAKVRADGRVTIPFLQDVDVAGMTPADIQARLRVKFKEFVVNPVVTVTLVEQRPTKVSVLGEVAHPGIYELDRGAGVLNALAAAGGMTDYAHRDGIYLLRHGYWADGNPAPARIRFRWSALVDGDPKASSFRLRGGDIVVVE